MWPDNVLTERLNLRYPIFQAPMGSITTPSLAAAVSDAVEWVGLACGALTRTTHAVASKASGNSRAAA